MYVVGAALVNGKPAPTPQQPMPAHSHQDLFASPSNTLPSSTNGLLFFLFSLLVFLVCMNPLRRTVAVDAAGFPAVYVTGSGVSMSALGAPDVGMLSFGEILDRVRRIADVVSIPVIADADTGYGGPLNVMRTVREFERAGVSA